MGQGTQKAQIRNRAVSTTAPPFPKNRECDEALNILTPGAGMGASRSAPSRQPPRDLAAPAPTARAVWFRRRAESTPSSTAPWQLKWFEEYVI
jgi:hypothetical protein